MALCSECSDPECPGMVVCPACGCEEHGIGAEMQIAKYGWCYTCQEDWERGLEESDMCSECGEPFDDNPGEAVCKTCEDWLVK